jgi:hypothetical protein
MQWRKENGSGLCFIGQIRVGCVIEYLFSKLLFSNSKLGKILGKI